MRSFHTISNIKISTNYYAQIGFFGCVSGSAQILNTNLNAIDICGYALTGGLIGAAADYSYITIQNCNVSSGTITGTGGNNFGGIIGATYSSGMVNIFNSSVSGVTIQGYYTGGIAGNGQNLNIDSCYFAGELVPLTSWDDTNYGGITAYKMHDASNCYSNREDTSAWGYGGTYYSTEYLQSADFAELLNYYIESDDIEWLWSPDENGGFPFVSMKILTVNLTVDSGISYYAQDLDPSLDGIQVKYGARLYFSTSDISKNLVLSMDSESLSVICGNEIIILSDTTVTVTLIDKPVYTISLDTTLTNGSVYIEALDIDGETPGIQVYDKTFILIIPIPDENSIFVRWWDGDISDPREYMVDSDITISAIFVNMQEINDLLNVEDGALKFATYGEYPFEITNNPVDESELVCASTNMGIDESISLIQTSVTGPGAIAFDWMVSSEDDYDFMSVCLDIEDFTDYYPEDSAAEWISGETDWASSSIAIPEGTHTVTWVYSKDGSVYDYNDRGYLKNVAFVTGEKSITVSYNSDYGTAEAIRGVTAGKASIGSTVELSAAPAEGYSFFCWKSQDGKVMSHDPNYIFHMGAFDVNIEAVFVKVLDIDIDWYKNPPEGADGSCEETPYILNSAEAFAGFAALVNNTANDPDITEYVNFGGEYLKLNTDIDLSTYYWEPIGTDEGFSGSFDGNGKTISGLAFDIIESYSVGLFGWIEGGTVKNLNVVMSAAVDKYQCVGGIAEFIYDGIIANCTSAVEISAGDDCAIGDIAAGGYWSNIENCTSVVEIVGGYGNDIGGIVGRGSYNSIQYCTSSGNISGGTWCCSGGIIGDTEGTAQYFCISYCSINTGEGSVNGGIFGYAYNCNVVDCLNYGDILASDTSLTGGIIGYSHSTFIGNSLNAGNLTIGGNEVKAGGVTASQYGGIIVNCLNAGCLTDESDGNSNLLGGITGYCNSSDIAYSYYAQKGNINSELEPFGEAAFVSSINDCGAVHPAIFKTGEAAWMLNRIIDTYGNYPIEADSGAWTQGDDYPVFADGDAMRRIVITDEFEELFQFAKQNEQVTIDVDGYDIFNIESIDVEEITDGSFIMPPYDVVVYATVYKWLTYDPDNQEVRIALPQSVTADAIIASYIDDRIIDIIKVPVVLIAHTPAEFNISTLDTGGADRIKVILWENFDNIRPLFNSLEESINAGDNTGL